MAGPAHRPLRLVLDTNIVVAGLLWQGPPRRLIESAIEGQAVELHSSPVLLDELAQTLGYSKFAARIESFASSIAVLVAQYTALVWLVVPVSVPRIVANDADDDHVIAAAAAAAAARQGRTDRHRGSQASAAHRNPSGHRHRHRHRHRTRGRRQA